MMLWNHVEVTRFRWVVRRLLGYVEGSRFVGKVPVASEDLSKYRVQGLLDARWSDVPAAEVEFDDGDESFDRIFDIGYGQEQFRVAHETYETVVSLWHGEVLIRVVYFVIRSNMLRGSRMKVGRTTRLKSAPGRS